jgi:hypothetical protein
MSDFDIEELRKTSQEISESIINKPTEQPIIPPSLLIKKRVAFQKPTVEIAPQPVCMTEDVKPSVLQNASEMFSLGGFNIPKHTIYLLIILIVIGIVLWVMSKNNDKKQRDEE